MSEHSHPATVLMYMKIGKLYAIRVDDMKPIRKHEIEESLDADELIYILESGSDEVVIADASVRNPGNLRKSA
jgi:hypothetical protein